MDFRLPDPDSYGRVTNPDRYRVVVDSAKSLIDKLLETYHVARSVGNSQIDFPEWGTSSGETLRLIPGRGTPLTIAFTAFPGVLVRFGSWGRESFPDCGCDACDEKPADVIQQMTTLIETAVAGGYQEELTRKSLRCSFVGPWGSSIRDTRLRRGEWRRHGKRGSRLWPQWPRR